MGASVCTSLPPGVSNGSPNSRARPFYTLYRFGASDSSELTVSGPLAPHEAGRLGGSKPFLIPLSLWDGNPHLTLPTAKSRSRLA